MSAECLNNWPKVILLGLLITIPTTNGNSVGGSISMTVCWKTGSGMSGLATRRNGVRGVSCNSWAKIGAAFKTTVQVNRTIASANSVTQAASLRTLSISLNTADNL